MCDRGIRGARYQDGPTTCMAHPRVRASIAKAIKKTHAVSKSDVRLATAMGLLHANTGRPLGLNDAVFYPTEVGLQRRSNAARAASPFGSLVRAPLASPGRRGAAGTRRFHALALLVDFPDNRGRKSPEHFQKLLFDADDPKSMRSYYRELTGGAIDVDGEVVGWIRAPHDYGYYTAGESGTGESYPNNVPGLLHDALTEFCKNDDLGRFDLDKDGYVDGIFLIHAGGGAEAEPTARRADMIWSHKWTLPRPFVNKKVKVYAYSTEPEDGRVGVFAHEFGHVLGLPDLYDSTYRSEGIGTWCLMASGSWCGDGNKPSRMSAWCLQQLGLLQPRRLSRSGAVTLTPLGRSGGNCVRVWRKGPAGPEYYLLEARDKRGLDQALPGQGLAIWHIDETQSSNTNPRSYLVALVQADGRLDLEKLRNDGDAGDLFPGTSRKKKVDNGTVPDTRDNDGLATGIAFSAIERRADGSVRLRVKI